MSSATNYPQIPPEIIEAIVNNLASDKQGLQACNLVSRAFHFPAHRHLFRHLTLQVKGWDQLAQRQICIRPQYYLSLVKSIFIDRLDPLYSTSHNRQQLLAVTRSLVNLTRVNIRYMWYYRSFTTHMQASKEIREILRECCRPTITSLAIRRCQIPLDITYLCTGISHLCITGARLFPPAQDVASTPRIPIKSLYLGQIVHQLDHLSAFRQPSCPWDFTNLETLVIQAHDKRNWELYVNFIENLTESVTSLAIVAPSDKSENDVDENRWNFDPIEPPMNLSRLPRLACLTLKIDELDPEGCTRIPWVINQLYQIPTDNQLTQLHLWVSIGASHTLTTIQVLAWRALDDLLVTGSFLKLWQVYIKVFYEPSQDIEMDEVAITFRDMFAKTREQKCLYVQATSQEWECKDDEYPNISRCY